jgi:hypothetical protein
LKRNKTFIKRLGIKKLKIKERELKPKKLNQRGKTCNLRG